MKKYIIPVIAMLLTLSSCIVIEEDPLVMVNPAVTFQSHIRGENVYVIATVTANPEYINPGNIPTLFEYQGEVSLYDGMTGELLVTETIDDSGLSSVTEISSPSASYQNIIIVASGRVSAFADKGTDGDQSNDLFIHQSDFYESVALAEVINLQDYPVVTLDPVVEYITHFRGTELYTTATVTANPTYLNTGTYPLRFTFNGVVQIYNKTTGGLLKSSSISGSGLSADVTVLIDYTAYKGFVIITSGTVTCTGDIGSDGDASNDILVSSSKYYELIEVDLTE
jgi:hypothetical protein